MLIKDMIAEISVVLNQASQAKRDIERKIYCGWDEEDNLQKKVYILQNTLSDANNDLDAIKDSLYKILEELEDKEYQAELEELSPFRGV